MNLEKALRVSIKVAGVVLTAPATIKVAAIPYQGDPLLVILIPAAALVLVEGAMLLGWHLLDTKQRATPQARTLYAATAVVGYFALWAIAYGNGEGLTGIAFRATLGIAVAFSIVESGVMAGARFKNRMSKQIPSEVVTRRGKRDYLRRLRGVEVYANELRAKYMKDEISKQLKREHVVTLAQYKPDRPPATKLSHTGDISHAREARASTADDRQRRAIELQRDNPSLSQSDIARMLGVSRQTASRYLNSDKVFTNGHS